MKNIYFETQRFVIRKWKTKDADMLFRLMSDPRVHAFASSNSWTFEHTQKYINLIINKNFQSLDLFHAACILKASNEIIGITGLNPYLPNQPEIEWKFGVKYWGLGYATEIGTATINNAFNTTNIEAIYAMAQPENTASIRVCTKIGMVAQGIQRFRDKEYQLYKIDRTQFLNPQNCIE